MPSGWTRLILENFEFPYERVFPPDLDKGGLHEKYDVIVFNGAGLQTGGFGGRGGRGAGAAGDTQPAGAPGGDTQGGAANAAGGGRGGGAGGSGGQGAAGGRAGFTPQPIPDEFARRQGQVSAQTFTQVKQFVQDGGTVIAIGASAMGAVQQFGLPITNHLIENDNPLPREKYYVPGAVLRVSVDDTNPLAHGLGKELDVFFDNDPVFTLAADTSGSGPAPRRLVQRRRSPSQRVGMGPAVSRQRRRRSSRPASAKAGCFSMAPEVLFRSQPHGSYKLFFNGLYLSVAPGITSK